MITFLRPSENRGRWWPRCTQTQGVSCERHAVAAGARPMARTRRLIKEIGLFWVLAVRSRACQCLFKVAIDR